MSRLNYPIKFKPIYQEKIWGGDKLNRLLHKDSPYVKTGESWEISAVKEMVSVVSNGNLQGENLMELCAKFPVEMMGDRVNQRFAGEFPLLIKFIDADMPLSVQVHPDDEIAAEYSSFGKNEMWVILNSTENSKIYLGFNEHESPETVRKSIESGEVMDKIHIYSPKKYDAFYVKAGTIHTIGANILLAEIQQTSDLTFRLFDFDRKDEKGNKRDLHIEESLRSLNYATSEKVYLPRRIGPEIINNQYFKVNRLNIENKYTADTINFDSFVIYMNLEGNAQIVTSGGETTLSKGETVLLPYAVGEFKISSVGVDLLEIYV